jgi:hypothetical protein
MDCRAEARRTAPIMERIKRQIPLVYLGRMVGLTECLKNFSLSNDSPRHKLQATLVPITPSTRSHRSLDGKLLTLYKWTC